MKVVVVGAGPSGLAAAHRLTEIAPEAEIVVLEAGSRAGGLVRTEHAGGFTIEHGPDSMITDKPRGLALAKRVGLEPEIIRTRPGIPGAYVVHRGKLERIPEGFSLVAPTRLRPLLRSPLLSWSGKARALLDLVLPRGASVPDESLAAFVRRRLGSEVLERLAQPLASGIYGADPERLGLRATMPRFLDAEREHGSVIRGLRARAAAAPSDAAQGARYGLFVSFRGGMQQLTDALASRLGARVRTGARVIAIAPAAGRWRVALDTGDPIDADAVVLAVGAPHAATLLAPIAPDAARELAAIRMGSSGAVTFGWPRTAIPHALDAYGFVVPLAERRPALASTWASVKFDHRAPPDHALIRLFLHDPGPDDDTLIRTARGELRALLGVDADPILTRVHRWPSAMPQYEVGHLDRVARVEAALAAHPTLALAGNALHGVGLPDTIRAAEDAADRLARGGVMAG